MNPGSVYQLRSSHLLPRHPAFQRVEGILDSCTYMWEYRKFLAASITASMPANDATFYHIQKAMDNIKEQSFDIVHTHLSSSSDIYIFPLTAQTRNTPYNYIAQ